jgi:DNA-binding CsgD family transcriptional regulator
VRKPGEETSSWNYPTNMPLVCPTIVGRTTELAALQTILGEVETGHARVVLLSGEAGIGKSRLVAELEADARAREFLVLQGNCFHRDLTSPYAPLIDLVRTSVAHQPLEVREAIFRPFAQEFLPLLPDLVTPPPTPAAVPFSGPEQEQRRLFAALTAFLTKLAAEHPLLLIVEDIHWCDESSLEFLHYLLRHSISLPWLVLLTYRADEQHPALINWLAQQDRERRALEFSLSHLTRSDVDTMLSAMFDLDPLPHRSLLEMLYPLTEGNPFFVEEVLTALRAAGGIFYAEGTWQSKALENVHIPRSIQAAVQQRSAHLSKAARAILTLAAVAGRRFDVDLLLQVTHQPEDRLLDCLRELLAAQLVVEESADRFAFRHALTREAIYADLLGRERKQLHRSIANTMERLYAPTLEVHLTDLAYHFSEAGIWEKAFEYARRAGEKALSFYAPRAAIDSFTRALTATYRLVLVPPPGLFLARGQAYELLGEFERARADYEVALQGSRSAGESRAEWEALLHLGMLWAGRDYERSGEYYRHAFELARTLDNPSITAHSLNRVGNWHLNVERPQEALAHHQQALRIFQELDDRPGIAETLDLLGMASYLGGDLPRGTEYYRQAVALFQELDDRQGLASSLATLTLRGITYQTDTMIPDVAHVSEALPDGELALHIARETEQRAAETYALITLAFCLGPQGDYARGLAYARQGIHLAEEIDHRQWMAAAHCALGTLYRDLLAFPQALQHLERALHLATETCSFHWIHTARGHLASAYVMAGELLQAERILQTTPAPTVPAQTLGQRLLWCAHAELALAQSNPSLALQIIKQLAISSAQRRETRTILRLARLHGETLIALKQTSEAEELLRQAREVARQQGAFSPLWRIHLALGKCYRVQHRYELAEESGVAARELVNQLALNVPEEQLRADFLRHAHDLLSFLPSPSLRRSARRTYDGLTAREREIAVRIARGQSSREIADALVISTRTVETHIGNILSKLGYTARTQIAAWAAQKGLVKKDE